MKPIKQTEKGGRVASRGMRYQKQFAASKCIQMLSDDSIAAVYCDFGEDCVVQRADSAREFYQVKSKDEGGGGYTLPDVCKASSKKKSILEKLYDAYSLNYSKGSFSFLVSNKDAEGDLLRLKLLSENANRTADEETALKTLFERIKKQIKPSDQKMFKSFLDCLRVMTNHPDLGSISLHNKMTIKRFFEKQHKIALSDRDLDIIYYGILELIDSRTSDSLSPLPDSAKISRDDVLNCISFTPFEKILVAGYTKDQINAMDHSVLEVKLDLAKFDGAFVDHAKKLRFGAKMKIREFKRLPSVGKLCDEIELKVEGICVEKLQRFKLGQYSNVMDLYDEIKEAFKVIIAEYGAHLGVTEDFLLGIMFDVTGRCGMKWVPK